MGEYIYIKTLQRRRTVTEIPKEMWDKKGLLPYEQKLVKVVEGEKPDAKEGFEIFKDKIVETRFRFIRKVPIDLLIKSKLEIISLDTSNYIYSFYPIFKQLSRHKLSEKELSEMDKFIDKHRDGANTLKEKVKLCISEEELDKLPNMYKEES